ncbi:DEAD/DEAH box helicase [Enorma phocaeensis]|uniref:DEAD/DEAH box helicase n=1 Tax=Enorma phocaeensis TaxID=1871019 RepID=UPI00320B5CCB
MRLNLSYDEGFIVAPVDLSIEKFKKSSLWKIRLSALRAAHPVMKGNVIACPADTPTSVIRRIIEQLERLDKRGLCSIDISSELVNYLNDEESYIEQRARVGISIKLQEDSVRSRFNEFRTTIDGIMKRPLREKQAWDAFFMMTMRHAANFSVPGSGKTASVLGVFAYLRELSLVDRLLVVSPINAFGSWRDEWRACFSEDDPCRSLSFHDVRFSNKSIDNRARELALNAGRYNLILMNYQACNRYEKQLHDVASGKTLLVFDEVHRVKRIDGVLAKSALAISEDAPFTIALTGTPIPNSYSDIYNLLHILYPNEYQSFFGFSKRMLAKPSQSDVARINESVQPFFCRTNKEMLGVPSPNPDKTIAAKATEEENELLEHIRYEMRGDPLAMIIRIMQLESNASMIFDSVSGGEIGSFSSDEAKALSGVDPAKYSERRHELAISDYPSSKLIACMKLLTDLLEQGRSVIVWCVFIQSIDDITARLSRLDYAVSSITGATDPEERDHILDAFKRGEIKALVTNPHTLAESVSLHTVCHDAVYYEYSYNLIHLLQSKDRIHRLGLSEGQYTQYYFLQTEFEVKGKTWSLDENIYQRLQEKERTMTEAIDHGVLEAGATDEQDLEIVFRGLFDDAEENPILNAVALSAVSSSPTVLN